MLALLCLIDAAQAEVRFVSTSGDNGNPGTSSLPWRDIQYGVDQLQAGDELRVLPGTYTEKVRLGPSHSGISIIGNDAIVDGSALTPVGREGLLTLTGASDVRIAGFTLQNFSTAEGIAIEDTPVGILIEGGGANLVIENNVVRNIANRSSCGQSSGCGVGANGIGVYGTTVNGLTDLVFRDNRIEDCILAASEAFTLNGNISGFELVGNVARNNNNIGFDFIGYEMDTCPACDPEVNRARNGYIGFNQAIGNSTNLGLGGFSNNPWYEGADGSAGGFYVDGGAHLYFEGNLSVDNDLGFEFASEMPGRATQDIVMTSNVVANNREAGLSLGGYSPDDTEAGGGSADRVWIINNSFYRNRGWGTEWVFQYRVFNSTLMNNIVFAAGDTGDAIEVAEPPGIAISSNLWWGDTTTDPGLIPMGATVLDPEFVAPASNDLRIAPTSPAIDSATDPGTLADWSDAFWTQRFGSAIPLRGTADSSGEERVEGPSLDKGADEFGTSRADILFADGFES